MARQTKELDTLLRLAGDMARMQNQHHTEYEIRMKAVTSPGANISRALAYADEEAHKCQGLAEFTGVLNFYLEQHGFTLAFSGGLLSLEPYPVEA